MSQGQSTREQGFTLIELMISTAVLGLVMAGLLGLLNSSEQAYSRGANTVDAQQNARVALDLLGKEIREAGYHPRSPETRPANCPSGVNDALVCPLGAGLYPSGGASNAPCWCFYPIVSPSATGLTLQYDWNGNGTIQTSGKVNDAVVCPTGAACRGEQVIYTYSSTAKTLQRQEIGVDASPVTVATGISSLSFTYLKDDNTPIATPSTSLDLIRSVQIQATIKPVSNVGATMTDQIRIRGR